MYNLNDDLLAIWSEWKPFKIPHEYILRFIEIFKLIFIEMFFLIFMINFF